MLNNNIYGYILSDIHFGKKDDKHLFQELQEAIFKKIEEEKDYIDFIEIAGDTFDRQLKMNEESGKLVSNFIITLNNLSVKYNFQLRFIKGTLSHDFNQLELFRELEISNPNLKIFSTVGEDNICGMKILQIPEEYVEDVDKFYKPYFYNKKNYYDFIFFHGTFDFAGYNNQITTTEKPMKNAPTFNAKKMSNLVKGAVLGGHIHQSISKYDVVYCGSFSRLGFGEEDDKGFYTIEYNKEDEEVYLDFVINDLAPTYVTIDMDDLPEDITEKAKMINKLKEKFDYIRIKSSIIVDSEQDIQMLKKFSESDNNIKVDIANKLSSEKSEEDKKYLDILKKGDNDLADVIKDFIKIKYDEDYNINDIKEILSGE